MCGQPVGAVEVGGAPAPAGQPPASALSPSAAAAYPHAQQQQQQQQQQSENQWFWDDPAGSPREQGAPAPGSQPLGLPAAGSQPPGLPAPGSDPYGPPPAGATMQHAGGPPWRQNPQGPGPGGHPASNENENTATMPGMRGYGPDTGNQWGPGGASQHQWGPGGGQWGGGQWNGPGAWPQQPGTPGRPGGNGRPGPRVARSPIVPALGVAALIVVVAAIIVATRGSGSGSSQQAGNGTGNPAAAPTASASAKPSANPQQQQAATQLSQLLSQSGGDRGDVNHAYAAVQACHTLPADQAVFAKAAANRQNLLSKLGNLPDASALNSAMLQDLHDAWTASAQADNDYANWAASLEHDCKPGKAAKNPNLKASYGPDATATNDKQKFTGLWNPLAGKYGLSTYTPGQL